jgi:hypothetical protein
MERDVRPCLPRPGAAVLEGENPEFWTGGENIELGKGLTKQCVQEAWPYRAF